MERFGVGVDVLPLRVTADTDLLMFPSSILIPFNPPSIPIGQFKGISLHSVTGEPAQCPIKVTFRPTDTPCDFRMIQPTARKYCTAVS